MINFKPLLDKRNSDHTNQRIAVDNNQVVSSVELLGIQIDDKLNLNLHISNICRPSANQLNAIITLKQFLGFKEKEILKNSCFMENLNYCALV